MRERSYGWSTGVVSRYSTASTEHRDQDAEDVRDTDAEQRLTEAFPEALVGPDS